MRQAAKARQRGLLPGILMSILAGCGGDKPEAGGEAPAEPVVVYSARAEQLIRPIFDAYTA